jgi:hypothetical protein
VDTYSVSVHFGRMTSYQPDVQTVITGRLPSIQNAKAKSGNTTGSRKALGHEIENLGG